MDYEAVPIVTMREEEEGVVDSVSGGERLASRLASMGLVPGSKGEAPPEQRRLRHYTCLGNEGGFGPG